MPAVVQLPAPPVGSVEVTAFPPGSTATHNEAEGHDTPLKPLLGSTVALVQALAPEVGAVAVTMFPLPSTATHSDTAGQETPLIG
jgi:hypothetical protein